MGEARYDNVADWYEAEFATSELGESARKVVLRLLGDGPGRLLDLGCGGGAHAAAFAERGWTVTAVDVSSAQLELAQARGVDVVQADAAALPLEDAAFDTVISMFTHTDMDDFAAGIREAARVLRPEGTLVYLGVHPCFVGPHAFVHDREVPELHPENDVRIRNIRSCLRDGPIAEHLTWREGRHATIEDRASAVG